MAATSTKSKIMVALSGGVDSTVCAMLLRDAGHTVRCVYFVMSDAHTDGAAQAQSAADALGLELEIVDLRKIFKEAVIIPFCELYCSGVTPNPCINCNPNVKFKALIDAADRHGFDRVATGHYARIEYRDADFALGHTKKIKSDKGYYYLKKAACPDRDQSYMLSGLQPEQLARLILPLGDVTKHDIRELAEKSSLPSAHSPDSQEICFVDDNDYPAYINSLGYRGKEGSFIAPDGTNLGPHKGCEHYTVGQRRGLDVSYGTPVYVREIQDGGDIALGSSDELFAKRISLSGTITTPYIFEPGSEFEVKVRSAARPVRCKIVEFTETGFVTEFEEPQRAPTHGQAAVFYDGEYVAGVMTITNGKFVR